MINSKLEGIKLSIGILFIGISIIAKGQDYPALEREIAAINTEDQAIRFKYIDAMKQPNESAALLDSLGKVMNYKDSLNLIKVSGILDQIGWVGKDKLSANASGTLFLVIQHSDLQTQKKYLPGIREAVKSGILRKSSLALLEDRIAFREHRLQLYGSQIGQFPGTNESYVLPLEDPEHVDARRAEMGLNSMADYLKNWDTKWDVAEYIKQLPKIKELNGFD